MRILDRAAAVLLVIVITACAAPRNATTAARPDAPPPPTSGTSAGAAGTSAVGKTAGDGMGSSGAVPAASAAPGAVDASLVKEGYRVVRRNDQILYCRSQSVTGTLFASTVCMTASQIANQRRDSQQSKDLLNQAHSTQCVGPECIGK